MALTIKQIIEDPRFHSLSEDKKREALSKIDVKFRIKPQKIQDKILARIDSEFNKAKMQPPEPQEEGFLSMVKEALPETILGFAGGVVSEAKKTPVAMAVSGLFGGGGEVVKQMMQLEEQSLGVDLPFFKGEDAPKTLLESIQRIGGAGTRQAVGELGGRAAIGLLGRLGRAVKPKLVKTAIGEPTIQESIEAVSEAFPKVSRPFLKPISTALGLRRPPLLISEATDSPIIDTLQNVAETSFFNGGRIKSSKQLIDDTVTGLIKGLEAKLTGRTGVKGTGEIVQETLQKGVEAFQNTAVGLYKNVDELAKAKFKRTTIDTATPSKFIVDKSGRPLMVEGKKTVKGLINGVNFRNVKASSIDFLDEVKKRLPTGSDPARANKLLRQLIEKPDTISFQDAHILRSDLLSVAREGKDVIGTRLGGIAADLATQIDEAMEIAAKNMGDEVLNSWRVANEFWKGGKNTFNSKFIKVLANSDPEEVILKTIKSGPSNLARLKSVVDDPKIWKKLEGHYFKNILDKSVTDELSRDLSGSAILKALRKTDREVLKILDSSGAITTLKKFATVLAANQAKQPGREATVFFSMAQAGGVMSFFTGKAKAFGFAILAGPLGLSRAMTNPIIVKMLTTGMETPMGAKELLNFSVKLSTALSKEGIEHTIEEVGSEVKKMDLLRSLSRINPDKLEESTTDIKEPPPTKKRLSEALFPF